MSEVLKGYRRVLRGAKHLSPQGIGEGDILIEEGRIAQIGGTIDAEIEEIIDLSGCTIFPGFVDLHVHLREPGLSYKETIASGSAAAARGGVTTLFTMPNLNPTPDTLETLQLQLDIINRDAIVNVIPYASITMGQLGEGDLVDFEALAPKVGGFSDDGRGVQSRELMREAMFRAAKVGRPIVSHCEVESMLHGGYIHAGEYARINGHRGISSESEWAQVVRDLDMVEETGAQYHICHISTKESVEALRQAKRKGLKVSGETAAHYLILTDMDIREEGRFKMNPPIRSEEDRQALIRAIQDGTIEAIATDHAPHSADEKSRGLEKSAFGVVGIEFSFAAAYTQMVRGGYISLEKLIDVMSTRPREIIGLPKQPIEVGAVADLVAINLDTQYKIDPAEFLSMGKATPLEGMEVYGRTKLTMVGGKIAFEERND